MIKPFRFAINLKQNCAIKRYILNLFMPAQCGNLLSYSRGQWTKASLF